jgi:hypothetical protein
MILTWTNEGERATTRLHPAGGWDMTEYRCLDCGMALGRKMEIALKHKDDNPRHRVIGRYIAEFSLGSGAPPPPLEALGVSHQ